MGASRARSAWRALSEGYRGCFLPRRLTQRRLSPQFQSVQLKGGGRRGVRCKAKRITHVEGRKWRKQEMG